MRSNSRVEICWKRIHRISSNFKKILTNLRIFSESIVCVFLSRLFLYVPIIVLCLLYKHEWSQPFPFTRQFKNTLSLPLSMRWIFFFFFWYFTQFRYFCRLWKAYCVCVVGVTALRSNRKLNSQNDINCSANSTV